MEHILEVKDLQTSFLTSSGEVKAVRGVSFFVNKGGSVKLNGRELVGLSPKEMRSIRGKEVAMIFQDPMTSLNPLIPVGAQAGEMLWSHDKSLSKAQREERVIDLFRMVRIPEPETRLKSFPHEFSGGMRQRVMIAMALACKPDLLIADEPTTALDVSIQDQILKLMRSIQKEMGMSIMFITHDLGVVAELCSRVLVMYGGLIMEEANIYDVFENPLHPYTMGLIASIPDINQDKSKKLQPIIGSPPDMIHPPEGCPFAPRCPYACRICLHQLPPVFSAGEGHKSRCWLLAEDAPSSGNPLKGRKGAKE